MPVKQGYNKGKGFYQYGDSGKKYYYVIGNEKQRKEAKRKSIIQGYAIQANSNKK